MKSKAWLEDINKGNLKVARFNMGLSTLEATKRMFGKKQTKDRVAEWESGKDCPTYKQLEKLASIYNLNAFHLLTDDKLPKSKSTPAFRTTNDKELSSKYQLHRFIDTLKIRQAIIRHNLEQDGATKNPLVGSGKNYKDPAKLADLIRRKIGYQPAKVSPKQTAFAYLRDLLHKQDVFVFKTMSTARDIIDTKDMKGLYLDDAYAPCIAINRRDYHKSQLFSLAHELAHMFRAEAKIDSIEFRKLNQINDSKEAFCNQVAANLLMPAGSIKAPKNKEGYSLSEIKNLAKQHHVSDLVSLYRLVELGYVSRTNMTKFRKKLQQEYLQFKQSELDKKGQTSGGNYHHSMRDSNGKLFDEFILSIHLEGRISAVEAQNILKMPLSEAL